MWQIDLFYPRILEAEVSKKRAKEAPLRRYIFFPSPPLVLYNFVVISANNKLEGAARRVADTGCI